MARLENTSFLGHRALVAQDLAMIDAVMIEVPNPRHPFGARGVGEVPIVPPMAAVANAINDAIGVRMHDLPMSPPRSRAAIEAQGCRARRSNPRMRCAASAHNAALMPRDRAACPDAQRGRVRAPCTPGKFGRPSGKG